MKTGFTKLRTLAPALADIRAAVIDPGMARRSNSNEKGDQPMSFNEQIQDILRRIVELEKVHTRYTGPPGRAATIRVGSVSTVPAGTPASVVTVGTPNATILNFAIPQGEDSTELNTLREERNDFREEKNSFRNELHEFRASVHEFGAALRAELHELHAHYADELGKVYASEVDAFCKMRDKACALIGRDGQ